MLFLLKMLPKLPATTSGIFLARIDVAACLLVRQENNWVDALEIIYLFSGRAAAEVVWNY